MKNKEDSHAKNLAGFREIISILLNMDSEYKPTNPEVQLENLLSYDEKLKGILVELCSAEPRYLAALKSRQMALDSYDDVIKLISAYTNSEKFLNDSTEAVSLIRKIKRSEFLKKKSTSSLNGSLKEISQVKIDNFRKNINKLIQLLKNYNGHSPEEKEVTITALTRYLVKVNDGNKKVIRNKKILDKIRLRRNKLLYEGCGSATGLTREIKRHVKTTLGIKDPFYKKIATVKLRKIRY